MAGDNVKPETMEQAFLNSYQPTERVEQVKDKGQEYLVHPFGRGLLTTAGTQFGVVTTGSTGVTSKSSALKLISTATIYFPGLNEAIDEIEMSLSADALTATSGSSVGLIWQWKSSTSSTWQALHTAWSGDPTTYMTKTFSGYPNPLTTTETARLPINLRLMGWNKTAGAGRFRVRNTSYVAVVIKRQ